jgi:hypothetical protein
VSSFVTAGTSTQLLAPTTASHGPSYALKRLRATLSKTDVTRLRTRALADAAYRVATDGVGRDRAGAADHSTLLIRTRLAAKHSAIRRRPTARLGSWLPEPAKSRSDVESRSPGQPRSLMPEPL